MEPSNPPQSTAAAHDVKEGSERDRQTSPRITEFNLGRLLTVPFLLPSNLFRAAIVFAVNFSNTFSRGIASHHAASCFLRFQLFSCYPARLRANKCSTHLTGIIIIISLSPRFPRFGLPVRDPRDNFSTCLTPSTLRFLRSAAFGCGRGRESVCWLMLFRLSISDHLT